MPHENTTPRRLLSHRRSPGILLGGKLDILPVSPPQHLKGALQAFIVLRLAHQLGCGPAHDLGVLRSPDYSSRVCRIWRGRARNRGRRIKEITLKDMKMLLAFKVKTRIYLKTTACWKWRVCIQRQIVYFVAGLSFTKTELIKRVMLLFCSIHLNHIYRETTKEILITKGILPSRP